MTQVLPTPDRLGGTPLLEIKNLEVVFQTQHGSVPALQGVDLMLMPGHTVAIVGESGSGKSTTAHAIINLLPGGSPGARCSLRAGTSRR